MFRVLISSLYIFLLIPLSVLAREKPIGELPTIDIPKVDVKITVDAQLNEPQWLSAKRVLIDNITSPFDNVPSNIKTEALLMENGETFFIAFIAEDPNPELLRAFLRDRDKAWSDDIVGIKIDTYNDERSAYRFMVNPLGVQIDGIEDAITGQESDSWDAIWESSGRVTEKGFIVEMALPLRTLNFDDKKRFQEWGIELVRFYPREENLRISNIYLDRDNSCQICQLVTAKGFSGAKQGDNLMIVPSLVAAKRETRDDNEDWESDNDVEASLDVRWGITPDTLLNATLNPDFSTVEVDSAQLSINNTFALFFQEKRPFFLDNKDYFDSNYNLIYTRNINAPNYGAKLTSKKGDHSLGLFSTDDDSTNILIPGNRNSSVASLDDTSHNTAIRYRYNVNEDTTIGTVSTLRSSGDYSNSVHAIDLSTKFSDSDKLKIQAAYSDTEYPDDLYKQFCDEEEGCEDNELTLRTSKKDSFTGYAVKADFTHNDRDWLYRVFYDKKNEDFRGDLGFMSRVDFARYGAALRRKWYGQQGDWWTKFNLYTDYDKSKNDNGELIEEEFDFKAELNANYSTYAHIKYSHRDIVGSRINKESLDIDGNTTLFSQNEYEFYFNSKPTTNLYIQGSISVGDAIDYRNNRAGDKLQIKPVINWNINKHLELKLRHTYRELDADGDNVFIARLTDLRSTYQFNTQSYLRLTLIYNNTSRNQYNYGDIDPDDFESNSKNLTTELLYAYKINPQTVFYLGYSDHHDSNNDFSDLKQDDRAIYSKVSYAWLK